METNPVQGCTGIFDGNKPLKMWKKEKSHFSFFQSMTGRRLVYGQQVRGETPRAA